MPNTNKPLPMDAIMADFEQAGFSKHSIIAMRQWFTGIDVSLTPIGEIKSQVPIKGRTEGIATTAKNLNADGSFNSTDNVHDGNYSLRTFQQSGSAIVVDNSGFEATNGPTIPGWVLNSAVAMAIDQGNPQAGKNSLKVTFSAQLQGVASARQYAVLPGSTFRVAGFARSDGTSLPFIQLAIFDKNNVLLAQAGTAPTSSVTWGTVPFSATVVAPANSSYALIYLATNSNAAVQVGWFDSIQVSRTLTSFEVTPINTAGTPRAVTGLLTQHSAGGTQIDASSSTWQFGDGTVVYNSGSTDPAALQTSYVTGDDPGYGGGSIPYIPRTTPADANAANGRLLFGKIITAGGTATSTGGGSGGGGPQSKAALA